MGSSDQSIDIGRKTLGVRLKYTALATFAATALSAAAAWAAHERSAVLERLASNETEIRGLKYETGNLNAEINWMRLDMRELMRWQGVTPRTPAPPPAQP